MLFQKVCERYIQYINNYHWSHLMNELWVGQLYPLHDCSHSTYELGGLAYSSWIVYDELQFYFFFFFLNNKVKENLRNKKEITGRSGRKEATCVNLRLICQMRHLFMAAKPRLDFDLDRMHLTCYAVCSVRFQYKMLNCRSERESLVLARLQAWLKVKSWCEQMVV